LFDPVLARDDAQIFVDGSMGNAFGGFATLINRRLNIIFGLWRPDFGLIPLISCHFFNHGWTQIHTDCLPSCPFDQLFTEKINNLFFLKTPRPGATDRD
jgi:hypothetical protein